VSAEFQQNIKSTPLSYIPQAKRLLCMQRQEQKPARNNDGLKASDEGIEDEKTS
jgi:hypothetical protein